jgi:ArsR family transcriptional regulator, virulence genes transcriptional regulator
MTVRPQAPPPGPDREGFELEADLIRVLANPKRLMIVDLLAGGPSTVTEISERLHFTLQNASQHLRVMRDRDIVRARRDGREVRYALTNPVLPESCRIVREALLATRQTHPTPVREEREPGPKPGVRATALPSRTRHPIAVTS